MKTTLRILFFVTVMVFAVQLTFSQTNTPCVTGSPVATVLTVNTSCTTTAGTTVGLTYQSNAANAGTPSCGSPGAPDGWYQFTAPASGQVTISTFAGTMTDGVMSLYSGTCGSFTELACNDNGSGMPSITQSGLTPGTVYYIRIWNWFSGTGTFTICVTTSAAASPCTSITNIAACGSSVTTNLSGAGGGWNIAACGFSTPGDEQIFSFTPATTGTYSLNVTSNTGGFIDYFWINSTSGCSSGAGWNCIDDIFSAGTYGSMSWTAGQTYYILLDPEGTGSYSATFSVNCVSAASDPCTSISSIAACGTSVTANMSGSGASWSVGACGFTTPGDEVIYSFTPATTGTYSLNVTGVTNGYIDLFWINSTSGCSSGGAWNCIDDIFSPGTYGSMVWTAGQTYYILLDPENTLGSSMTFSLNCPTSGTGPCATATNIVGCGASYSGTLSGTGAWSPLMCGFSTPGVEAVYSYTATTTGNHSFNFTAISGGFIDVAYQAASCNSTGWTCIDDVISTGATPSFNLTAGTTYYFLLDPEGTGTYTYTFNLDCPGSVITASDCNSAVNICSNATFQIDPNGYGAVMEIPPLGSVGNPDNANPGGSGNWGCLRSASVELNSTWMIVNIATSGNLEFSFGAGGAQAGFYDWIMYPYSATACSQIPTGTYAPVRCNWNGSSSGGTGCSSAANLPSGASSTNFEAPLPVTAGQQYVICFSNYSSATTNVPLSFFGTATVSCTPLPSELLNFDGKMINKEVFLDWTTLTQTNTSHFVIERSHNGIDFTAIGTVNAAGNSNQQLSYSFVDENPMDGINYYRLQSVDFNHDAYTSRVISVELISTGFEITEVYPNPTNDLFSIELSSNEDVTVEIELTDITGKRILFLTRSITSGLNTISVNSNEVADGVYTLSVSDRKNNLTKVKRLYKQQ